MFETGRSVSRSVSFVLGAASVLALAQAAPAELIGTTVVSVSGVHPHADVVTNRLYLAFDDERDQLLAAIGDRDMLPVRFWTRGGGPELAQNCLALFECLCDLAGPNDGGGDSWLNIGEEIGDTSFSPGVCDECPPMWCVSSNFFEINNGGYFDTRPETPVYPDSEGRVLVAQFSLPVRTCFAYMGTAAYNDGDTGDLTLRPFRIEVCPCAADSDRSGVVDLDDLLAVLARWGEYPECVVPCAADINLDCAVDFDDLLIVLGTWGACDGAAPRG